MKKCKRCKTNETPPGIATCVDCRTEIEQKKKAKIDRVARELAAHRQQRRGYYIRKTARPVLGVADILRLQDDAYSLALARRKQGLL